MRWIRAWQTSLTGRNWSRRRSKMALKRRPSAAVGRRSGWQESAGCTSMTDYLFVLTRDPSTHPSAGYVLRSALGQCRRGRQVVVYLQHSAVDSEGGDCANVL